MTRIHVFAIAALALPIAVAGQQQPDWRPAIGGGLGISLHRGDDGRTGSAAGVARAGLERLPPSGTGIAVEWIGSWLAGDFGSESRHHAGVTASLPVGDLPLRARLGLGIGLATIVTRDGPTDAGPPGDSDVDVGGHIGASGLAGLEMHLPLAPSVSVVPTAELIGHRASDFTYVTCVVTARILFGF